MFSFCSQKKNDVGELTEISLEASTGMKGRTLERQHTFHTHGVRTQADASVPAERALQKLKEGNSRYVEGQL